MTRTGNFFRDSGGMLVEGNAPLANTIAEAARNMPAPAKTVNWVMVTPPGPK